MAGNVGLRPGKKEDAARFGRPFCPRLPTRHRVNFSFFKCLKLLARQQIDEFEIGEVKVVIVRHVLKRHVNRRAFGHADALAF